MKPTEHIQEFEADGIKLKGNYKSHSVIGIVLTVQGFRLVNWLTGFGMIYLVKQLLPSDAVTALLTKWILSWVK